MKSRVSPSVGAGRPILRRLWATLEEEERSQATHIKSSVTRNHENMSRCGLSARPSWAAEAPGSRVGRPRKGSPHSLVCELRGARTSWTPGDGRASSDPGLEDVGVSWPVVCARTSPMNTNARGRKPVASARWADLVPAE